jgi:hypothetical protein
MAANDVPFGQVTRIICLSDMAYWLLQANAGLGQNEGLFFQPITR